MLLRAGADINMRDEAGNTFLHFAQHRTNPVVMKILLNAGLDINVKNNEGQTVLHNCIHNWRMETIDVILAAAPDMNARDNAGNTALYYAIKGKKFSPDSECESQATLNVIRRLIEANAATDFVDSEGNSLLHLAMNWSENSSNMTYWASKLYSRANLVTLLIERGLHVNARNHLGQTPLMLVIDKGDLDTIRRLCAVPGIDRNARDIMGNTALYRAQQAQMSIGTSPVVPISFMQQLANDINYTMTSTHDHYAEIIRLLTE
jgi:ankyrin repeat protein